MRLHARVGASDSTLSAVHSKNVLFQTNHMPSPSIFLYVLVHDHAARFWQPGSSAASAGLGNATNTEFEVHTLVLEAAARNRQITSHTQYLGNIGNAGRGDRDRVQCASDSLQAIPTPPHIANARAPSALLAWEMRLDKWPVGNILLTRQPACVSCWLSLGYVPRSRQVAVEAKA